MAGISGCREPLKINRGRVVRQLHVHVCVWGGGGVRTLKNHPPPPLVCNAESLCGCSNTIKLHFFGYEV